MREHAAQTATKEPATAQLDAQRAGLLGDLDEAKSIPGIDAGALDALQGKLAANVFNLVVVGEFKRGKSSVVNALLGADVLPTGVVPLTSVVTVLRHGEPPAAAVTFEDGSQQVLGLDALPDFVTERGNPRNRRHVRGVEVTFPAPWLSRGIRLVDTPGIGSVYRHNTDTARGYLPQADAVIFVASVEQPVSHAELAFLADIRARADRVFCLLNKIDHLSIAELAESVAFSTKALREALEAEVPIFPVSARRAIESRRDGDGAAWARSGFATFDAALQRFLRGDSEAALLRSIRRHLLRLLAGARLAAELELGALDAPLATLDANLRAFAAKKTEVTRQGPEFEALLMADVRRLIKEKIESDIGHCKRTLARQFDEAVPGWLREAATQHETSPEVALEQRIVAEVRRAWDDFREREDAAVSADFDRIHARFRGRVQQSADELMRYSAELFAVRFEAPAVEPLQAARSRFYYKFWQEPTSLVLLGHALARLLPGPLRRALLLRRARRRVAELVEMQAGRLRSDFEQRVLRAAQEVRTEMLGHIEATVHATDNAIAKGRALQAIGGNAADARRREIAATIARIGELESRSANML